VTLEFDRRLYEQVCFACGRHNAFGLQLRFTRAEDGSVVAAYEPRPQDAGFPGVMHGGILMTLLDEAMAWALWSEAGALGVTAKMETRYRRTVTLDGPLTLRGRVARARGRRFEVEATLDDASGARLADASALFLRLPPAREREVMRAIGWGHEESPSSRS
jgi:uncharacterized protein (TIGR00369 family)